MDSDYSADEEMIAKELKKILEQDLPAQDEEERKLFKELEARIANQNSKALNDQRNAKKKSLKAKILAASSLARAKEKPSAINKKEDGENLNEIGKGNTESANVSSLKDQGDKVKEKIIESYNNAKKEDQLRKQQGEDILHWTDDESGNEGGTDKEKDDEHSPFGFKPLEKLKRSVKKAQMMSKMATGSTYGGGDNSDDEIRMLTKESEKWLKKQRELEKQLVAKSSKAALRNKYMNAGAAMKAVENPTDKQIDELLDEVMSLPTYKKNKGNLSKQNETTAGALAGKQRTDMGDVVRKAMALRAEAESQNKNKGRVAVAKKTAKKSFPVKLESSESENNASDLSSDVDDDDDEVDSDDLPVKGPYPDLVSPSETSDDDDPLRQSKMAERYRGGYSFTHPKPPSDYNSIGDAMSLAINEAKRNLGKKPTSNTKTNSPTSGTKETKSLASKLTGKNLNHIDGLKDRLKKKDVMSKSFDFDNASHLTKMPNIGDSASTVIGGKVGHGGKLSSAVARSSPLVKQATFNKDKVKSFTAKTEKSPLKANTLQKAKAPQSSDTLRTRRSSLITSAAEKLK